MRENHREKPAKLITLGNCFSMKWKNKLKLQDMQQKKGLARTLVIYVLESIDP